MVMPNRYEREIEEILRNLEQSEPKTNQKPNERRRQRATPPPRPRPQARGNVAPPLSTVEWLLIVAVVLALVAGGYAYIMDADLATGILAVISFICVVLIACSQFILRPRQAPKSGYGNVTRIRRGPMSDLRARWQLMRLRMRYRKRDTRP